MQVIPDGIPGFSDYPSPALPIALFFPFLVSLLALHFILFKPLLAWLAGREEATVGARKEAAELEGRVGARLDEIERRLEEARAAGREVRAEARARALDQEQRLLADARAQAEQRLDAALAELERERASAATLLHESATGLSREIATKVLGRELGA